MSTAADVYSFGVVLLEIFIRKRPTDDMFKDGLSIVSLTEMNFPDRVLEIVDSQLLQKLILGPETQTAVNEKIVQCLTYAGGGCKAAWNQECISQGKLKKNFSNFSKT